MSRSLGVTNALREVVPEWSLELFVALSMLGDLVVIVPALAVLYLTDVGQSLVRDDRSEPLCSTRTAFLVAVVFGGCALVVLLKGLFALPRTSLELQVAEASVYGFPSGHTMGATIFFGSLAAWFSVGQLWSRFAGAGLVISLVGFSRLVLGVHYLVDVLAAVLFGTGYLVAIAWLAKGRPERAFAVAIGIAVLATVVTGGSARALLALAGTVGAGVGWQVIELPSVRGRMVALVGQTE
ncbi:phosphatase PAP2 family protein [Natronosalvus halobius]|uniref:phosphatase PAP2 family protein n=1 Tax=Natronosalvus halobius TaxID=2953746 RepID=UPI0020A1DC32|nr:phosphatase PAP2 family protein [Natronosalvus halobius]USZ71397.1 phosphatase PAP2 family protein [Natronosalvus halobius]